MAMKKHNRKEATRQAIHVMKRDAVFVGLDVHKSSIHMAVRVNGDEVATRVLCASSKVVCDTLEAYKAGLRMVVYEAGPTGYGLVRELRRRGFPAQVIDPVKMPRPAGKGSKSDGLDCRILAQLAERNMLPFVAVPTEEEEARRQVVRLREQVVVKVRRVKHQIKSFLLLHGIEEPKGFSSWSKGALETLRNVPLSSGLRFSLDVLLDELEFLVKQRERVMARMKMSCRAEITGEQVSRLCSHPGVGEVTALMFLSELYRPERFGDKRQVACYLGLAPRVRQSGETRREGPTIQAGQGALRSKLVEASWVWVRRDEQAAKVYGRLVRNTGSGKKAIVGMARRMGVNLWSMMVNGEDYHPVI
jgi:transposase